MAQKWTPGPWSPAAAPGGWDAVREPGGQLICKLALNNEANMLLIAAAPELYEALARCLPYLLDHAALTLSEGPGDIIAHEKAVAALTKARGEAP